MPGPIDSEKAQLREALQGEHRVLKRIQKVMIDALPPDSGKSDSDIVGEIWEGTDMDPGPEIEEGEAALNRADGQAVDLPEPANDGRREAERAARR
jgi:hypothetical protein